jgi:hypothetical protein
MPVLASITMLPGSISLLTSSDRQQSETDPTGEPPEDRLHL